MFRDSSCRVRPQLEELEDRRVPASVGLADWGPRFFAPYVNVQQAMANGQPLDYAQAAQAGNAKFLTLGFVDADASGNATWQGDPGSQLGNSSLDTYIHTQVDNIRNQLGGDVMISFGGALGGAGGASELAQYVASTLGTGTAGLNSLVQKYQQVIDSYDLTHIDFDIEGTVEADTAANGLRSRALAKLQQNNPGLQVHFTLAGEAPFEANLVFGLTPGAQAVVNSALDAGVDIAGVNVMTMDFSNYVNYFDDTPANRNFYQVLHNPGGFPYAGDRPAQQGISNVADVAIRNANAELQQLQTMFTNHGIVKSDAELRAMIGITPEIGRNYTAESTQGQAGDSNVIFSLANAQTIVDFAAAQSFGRISMWSLGRDQSGNPADLNHYETNSSLVQNPYQFSQTFSAFDVPPSPPPPPSGQYFAVGGSNGAVKIYDTGNGANIFTFRPLDVPGSPYTGLVEVAIGDLNGDGDPEVFVSAANPAGVAGLAASKAGRVFVFDGATANLIHTFTPFANTDGPGGQAGAYINGLNIAVGDVNGDGTIDLIAGTRGMMGSAGRAEYGRLVVIDGSTDAVIGGIQKPFGPGYQKGVVVAAGNADGAGGDEIAVTRGGPVASTNPTIQQIKVKVLQLQGGSLTELPLNADGSTSFAPFGSLSGPAKAIKRDGRVAFVDVDGDGHAELVFSALDPLTNPGNGQVRVGVYSLNVAASAGAATIRSTGPDAGTYLTGTAVVDHAITHVATAGASQNLALITESASPGIAYLDPLTGATQAGSFGLTVLHGGITIDRS